MSGLEINLGVICETGWANQDSECREKIEKRRVPRFEPPQGNRPQPIEVMRDWVREDKKPGKCCVQIKQARKQKRPTGSTQCCWVKSGEHWNFTSTSNRVKVIGNFEKSRSGERWRQISISSVKMTRKGIGKREYKQQFQDVLWSEQRNQRVTRGKNEWDGILF